LLLDLLFEAFVPVSSFDGLDFFVGGEKVGLERLDFGLEGGEVGDVETLCEGCYCRRRCVPCQPKKEAD
jgi:hypothetical protein